MKNLFCCALALAAVLSGCRQAENTDAIPAVSGFDAARYAGRWYEIARLPHWFEEDMTDVEALYTLRPDGKFDVTNAGMQYGKRTRISGMAELQTPTVGLLEVSFGWPKRSTYKIIWLDPEYQTAVVIGETKAYAWILAREKHIPTAKLNEALTQLEGWDFAVQLLQYPNGQVLPGNQRR